MENIPVITIDGPSGVGKGTVSLKLAQHLEWHVLDSGAIYRVLAFAADNTNLAMKDEVALVKLANNLDFSFETSFDAIKTVLDGKEITADLRKEACGRAASKLAVLPKVRLALLERQRIFRQSPGLVADGRDMGTIVFPNASLKIFLTASCEERANRRYKQLINGNLNIKLPEILTDIIQRDKRDKSRKAAPLIAAEDAYIIDTTALSIEAVVQQILAKITFNTAIST
ncbi:MAG: (d)CMP kinase [Thiomargarita sp.]|nr:(d)CMP kinase [Thiomargarita sp.]